MYKRFWDPNCTKIIVGEGRMGKVLIIISESGELEVRVPNK